MKAGNRIRPILGVLLLIAVLAPLSGCNTMKGAGRDIERGGEHLQDAAEDAKN